MTALAETKSYSAAFDEFRNRFPEYASTGALDDLRASDFRRLDEGGHVYLDYTGGSLYAEHQVRKHHEMLTQGVYGNPHSANPTSSLATELVHRARERVLRFLNAPSDEYTVVFTPNASGSLKLVGESYPFTSGDQFLLTFDNHNSVNGIREFDRARGAKTTYIPVTLPELRVDDSRITHYFDLALRGEHNLFAYPAQSNFSGVQHPLEWVDRAKERGWDVILDAAAFAPTNRLDLSVMRPDYVALSFYKIFGYPTGIGALVARRDALEKLHRPWFAGGTIEVASVQADRHVLSHGETAFEDGTPNYLGIPAIEFGFDLIETVGLDTIHTRVVALTGWLLDAMTKIRHTTGVPLVRIYGPTDMKARGGTITFNFYDRDGRVIDHRYVEAQANKANISLRTGCFCNPGAGEMALGISKGEIITCFTQHNNELTLDDFRMCIDGKSTGAVRISLGIATNFADAYRFVEFARGFVG
ncbi:MAG: aminotransferase class V-fold PLP-dependent enzyme [Thermoanaerobaculia bacterium]